MKLIAREESQIFVVSVEEPRIDAANCLQFKENFRQLAPADRDRIVLDLNGVEFVDSSGLGAIVGVMKLLAPQTRLELCNLGELVQKVLKLTRMDRVFVIHSGLGDARDTPTC